MSISLKSPHNAPRFASPWMELRHREEVRDRIRQLMQERGVNAEMISDAIGIKERSVRYWISPSKPGGIEYKNVKKLAEFFDVEPSWIWSGREKGATPDVLEALNGAGHAQLDRIEKKLDALLRNWDARWALLEAAPVEESSQAAPRRARGSSAKGKQAKA